ncbi:superoxide dismutase [Ni] [Streptomyces sp. NPDC041003]|uniref:superoxide dismutase [Ni] n=1 Tax=Streptomyces sp. NPDC041003 TaxID=3155730 RepID=UPI0033DD76EF
MLSRLFAPKAKVSAHCDLPCGVYDPAQARIEAESVKAVQEKYQANDDADFRARAITIKEQRAELAKHHVSVLWSVAAVPSLDDTFPLPPAPWFPKDGKVSMRWMLLHLVEEFARHAGHADIIRESLDGTRAMG